LIADHNPTQQYPAAPSLETVRAHDETD